MAEHIVRELIGNGGDVTALVMQQIEMLTVVSVKVSVWGEQLLAFLGNL
jgi:hypothetical protein